MFRFLWISLFWMRSQPLIISLYFYRWIVIFLSLLHRGLCCLWIFRGWTKCLDAVLSVYLGAVWVYKFIKSMFLSNLGSFWTLLLYFVCDLYSLHLLELWLHVGWYSRWVPSFLFNRLSRRALNWIIFVGLSSLSWFFCHLQGANKFTQWICLHVLNVSTLETPPDSLA